MKNVIFGRNLYLHSNQTLIDISISTAIEFVPKPIKNLMEKSNGEFN